MKQKLSLPKSEKISYLEVAPASLADFLKKDSKINSVKIDTHKAYILHHTENKYLHEPITNFNPLIFQKDLEIPSTHCSKYIVEHQRKFKN